MSTKRKSSSSVEDCQKFVLNETKSIEEKNVIKKKKYSKNLNNNIDSNSSVISNDFKNDLIIKVENNKRLGLEFYDKYCLDLSKELLGKILIRRFDDNKIIHTKIVEVEAYLGGSDAASHSYNDKCTDKNKAMFMQAGTAYVYNIYGIYCCFNISSKESGGGVLIRALEPLDEFDLLKKNRNLLEKKAINIKKDLTSGPSKLCQALNITKDLFNTKNLCIDNNLWVENDDEENKIEIVASKRINIDYAGEEACNKLYRFYIKNNKFVSIIDKNAVDVNE